MFLSPSCFWPHFVLLFQDKARYARELAAYKVWLVQTQGSKEGEEEEIAVAAAAAGDTPAAKKAAMAAMAAAAVLSGHASSTVTTSAAGVGAEALAAVTAESVGASSVPKEENDAVNVAAELSPAPSAPSPGSFESSLPMMSVTAPKRQRREESAHSPVATMPMAPEPMLDVVAGGGDAPTSAQQAVGDRSENVVVVASPSAHYSV